VPSVDRLNKLQAMLQRQPGDPFLLYGIAMEHKGRGELDLAIEFLQKAAAADPNYSYAHYQMGQVREIMGDVQAARLAYRAGIEAARRAGDEHARSEIETALAEVE
jgi:tetratricopeptide (TPR) repeat protein